MKRFIGIFARQVSSAFHKFQHPRSASLKMPPSSTLFAEPQRPATNKERQLENHGTKLVSLFSYPGISNNFKILSGNATSIEKFNALLENSSKIVEEFRKKNEYYKVFEFLDLLIQPFYEGLIEPNASYAKFCELYANTLMGSKNPYNYSKAIKALEVACKYFPNDRALAELLDDIKLDEEIRGFVYGAKPKP